jgi:hypothetical protein
MTLSSADQLFADKILTEIAMQETRNVRSILGMRFSILVEVLSLVVIVFYAACSAAPGQGVVSGVPVFRGFNVGAETSERFLQIELIK